MVMGGGGAVGLSVAHATRAKHANRAVTRVQSPFHGGLEELGKTAATRVAKHHSGSVDRQPWAGDYSPGVGEVEAVVSVVQSRRHGNEIPKVFVGYSEHPLEVPC
jgi:hypothetical protein